MKHFDSTKYIGLADACDDGILFVDTGGLVAFANEAAELWLAVKFEALVGIPCTSAFPTSKDLMERCIKRALSGGNEQPFEIQSKSSQRSVWLRVRIAPVRESGRIVGAAVFVRNISDQKEVIQEVRIALEIDRLVRAESDAARSHFRAFFESAPGLYLVLEPKQFRIVAASEAYLRATMTRREMILGRGLFEVFPDQPGDKAADGVRNLRASLERVKSTKRQDVMAVQRYPIRRDDAAGGGWEERFWSPCNSPVYGSEGEILYNIHRVEDVTEFVRERLRNGISSLSQTNSQIRAEQMEAEIIARGKDLQRLNEQLRESELRFRELAESIKKVFWMFNVERTELIYVSPAYEEIWGRKCEDLYVHPEKWIEAIIESDRARIADALRNHPRRGFNEEYRIQRTDGTIRWIADRAFPVHDANGGVYRIAGVARDITDRKRAEEALRQSEWRLRTIFNQAGAGIAELDLSGAWRFVNQRFSQIVGRPSEELLALNFRDITHPGDLSREEERFSVLTAGGADFQIEKRFVRPDGEIVWVTNAVCGVRDTAGQVQYIVSVSQDVTDRRLAEDALREREERLRLIVENVKDFAIFAFDEGGSVSSWNPGAERVFGFSETEIVGRNVAILYTAEDREKGVPEEERRISNMEGCAVNDRWHVRKNGERIYVSGAVRPLRVAALQSIMEGKPYLTARAARVVLNGFLQSGAQEYQERRISSREREVVQLLAEGKTNKEVASILGITSSTAETHRNRIMRKLGCKSIVDLVRYAIRNRIVEP